MGELQVKSFILTSNTSTSHITPMNIFGDGGTLEVFASGSFGGGSLTVEQTPDGVNWFAVGAAITDKSRTVVEVHSGLALRLTLSGATSPVNVLVFVAGNGV